MRILEASGKLLAADGPEGLSVSRVAQLAGVNRGTAYQHFSTRDELLRATTTWVSERLCSEVFGELTKSAEPDTVMLDSRAVTSHLAEFAMNNPELGRVWLFEVLGSEDPSTDPFWKLYKSEFKKFVDSDLSQPGIDIDVHAAIVLMSVFLWPIWARAHARSKRQLRELGERFVREMLRLSLYGTIRPGAFPDLEAMFRPAAAARAAAARPKDRKQSK